MRATLRGISDEQITRSCQQIEARLRGAQAEGREVAIHSRIGLTDVSRGDEPYHRYEPNGSCTIEILIDGGARDVDRGAR